MAFNSHWMEPKTQSSNDITATARAQQFSLGWFAQPLFGNGDYPDEMKNYVSRKSTAQGLPKSRLPEFTDQEKSDNRGKKQTTTFLLIQFYFIEMIEAFIIFVLHKSLFNN